jgi:hypothetical protein
MRIFITIVGLVGLFPPTTKGLTWPTFNSLEFGGIKIPSRIFINKLKTILSIQISLAEFSTNQSSLNNSRISEPGWFWILS